MSLSFFNDTATTEIYTDCHTLSLPDALPICSNTSSTSAGPCARISATPSARSTISRCIRIPTRTPTIHTSTRNRRSEEHTSELQSLMRTSYAVLCLKKKQNTTPDPKHNYDLVNQKK